MLFKDRLFFVVLALGLGTAHGQSPAPSPTPATPAAPTLLNEVVVVGTRIDETASRLGAAFTKIDADEIERDQFTFTKQAVNLSPGVYAPEAGAFGGATEISIRGNRPDHTLTLVDGVRVNSAMFNSGIPFWSYASSLNLENVEIVRGPYSPLFGSDAIAGVVSLQTRRGSGPPVTTLFVEGGSYSLFRGGLLSSGSLGSLDYSFHYAHEDAANDRPNNDTQIDSGSLRLDYTVNEKLTLGLSMRTHFGRFQEPGSVRVIDFDNNDPNAHSRAESTAVAAYAELVTTELWTQRLTLGYYRERYEFENAPNPPILFLPVPETYRYLAQSANYTADWQHTIQVTETNRVTTGAAFLYETGHDNSFSWETASHIGFYLQDQWEIVENLTLTGGFRLDHHEISGNAFTYRFAGAYLLEPTRTKFRASYGTGYKAPGFYALFSTESFALGNPNLNPERSRSWDAGIDQYFLDDRMVFSATWFHNDIDDLIVFVETGIFTGSYANRDSAESHGIELSVTAKLVEPWQLRLAYTWTESEETTPLGTVRTDYRPRHVVSAESSYRFFDKLTVGAGVYYVAQREAVDFAFFPAQKVDLEDYTIVRVHARYEINDHFSVYGRIENLGDDQYVTRIGFPGLGRGYYGGMEIRF